MQLKRLISACIISVILMSNTCTVLASDTEISLESTNENNINIQLDNLYTEIADNVNIDSTYIKRLHILAGGKVVYADKQPNIYGELTIKTMRAPMDIDGANTEYRKAEFIQCPDSNIERPSKYYMPDAVYSVSYDIAALMGQRYNCNRGGMQIYFDSLQEEVRQNIVFYEAVLIYTGANKESIDKFYQAYEKILYDKQSNENVVEEGIDGKLSIKHEFLVSLHNIGITDDILIDNLAILLSFDDKLAIHDNVENIKDTYIVPYRLNYTSRENMMIAAMSLCGKVRYVWGGGHSGASFIDGINPMWEKWETLYPDEPYSYVLDENGNNTYGEIEGFDTCIKPSGSWCPIHGGSESEYHGEIIESLDEYISLRAETYGTSELLNSKYRDMLSKVNYENGINVHTLDGLDCSGYVSWIYNQITDKHEYNSVARNFAKQSGMKEVQFGEELLPGDTFAWTEHIVMVVGKLNDKNNVYITIEQTTNVLKFGVIYYDDADSVDIEYATEVARQANQLIGGLNQYEEPHVYCMNTVEIMDIPDTLNKIYTTKTVWFPHIVEDEEYNPYDYVPEDYEYTEQVFVNNGYELIYYIPEYEETIFNDIITYDTSKCSIGRLNYQFIDENTIISDYDIPLKEMNAIDIIQYTITKLPISYISGYNGYKGNIFNKDLAYSNLGVTIALEN